MESDCGMSWAPGNGPCKQWPADVARGTLWAGGQGARRGGVRLRGRANGWGQEIKADGRTASESYERDDGAMRMRAGRISGLNAGCIGTRRKQPYDGILSYRTFGWQRVPLIKRERRE
jgi:hypothetical protein